MDVSCTDISKYSKPHVTLFIQLLELQKRVRKELKVKKTKWEDYIAWQEGLHKNVWMLFLGVSGLI